MCFSQCGGTSRAAARHGTHEEKNRKCTIGRTDIRQAKTEATGRRKLNRGCAVAGKQSTMAERPEETAEVRLKGKIFTVFSCMFFKLRVKN